MPKIPRTFLLSLLPFLLYASAPGVSAEDSHPLSQTMRDLMEQRFEAQAAALSRQIRDDPGNVELYSQRGDALFFLGRFEQAVRDYDRMVELDARQDASHWRRGIACFYAGEFDKAAAQFSRYDSFDDVDRENGIWRYLSQYRAGGKNKARAELLKYEKDDREPFGDLYRLFAGELTGEQILERIGQKQLDPGERDKQLFYARLYIGLNELVEGRDASARSHLRQAVASTWGRHGGYGPQFMWHVARLQYEILLNKQGT